MTFGSDHYVPVLKVKRGEKKTLELLAPSLIPNVTPLLEIVEGDGSEAHLDRAFEGLDTAVGRFHRCFLDAREIEKAGVDGARAVFDRAEAMGIAFTPVTGISRTSDVAAALSHRRSGVAIRLTRSEFETTRVAEELLEFLRTHRLDPSSIDLILDIGAVEDMVVAGIARMTAQFLGQVPNHRDWRTFTCVSSAFPRSMAVVGSNSDTLVERSEWQAWRDHLHARRETLQRLPTFGDCAIQHPQGVEGFDPRTMQVSASIRYTLSDQWLLIKGRSTRQTPAKTQFPMLARRLVIGDLSAFFAGSDHCAGCEGMAAAAGGAPKFGSAEVWRRLGTTHHITRAVEQLRLLLGS